MRNGRWQAGWTHTEAGVSFRVVPGKKHPDDLRLEWYVPDDGWAAVTMATAAILADFWFENEDILYPPPARGGRYFLEYLDTAARQGWTVADSRLKRERLAKESRPVMLPVAPSACGRPAPHGTEVCAETPGHVGPHKAASWVWPQEKAS